MARESSRKTARLAVATLRNPHLWVVSLMLAILVVIHYHEVFANVWILDRIGSVLGLGLTRQTFERILFLIPITYGAVALGTGGGISVLALSAAAMLPRVFIISAAPREALFETGGIIFTGALVVSLLHAAHKGRQRLAELEATQSMLNLQIKRLGTLHAISSLVSQSLEPTHCVAVMDKLGQAIEAEATWLYLWDRDKEGLMLAASSGLSGALPGSLEPGESVEGAVAQSGQPAIVEDLGADSRAKSAVVNEGVQSALIVPLVSKGETVGALGIGTRLRHSFSRDELDLLRAVGDQISMAIENARLYDKERLAAEALRISERNYRELFENASDAIWVHDLSGRILAVNGALERLTGYKRDDLIGAGLSLLLTASGIARVDREVHGKVLRGEQAESTEQEFVRKDGSSVIVQMGTSLITKDGEPWAFQHIARDITEEKRLQENLRFYARQVTEAQEAERKRIARELHDDTAQALVAVSRSLDDLASGASGVSVEGIRERVRSVLQEVRHFSQQLRPSILDDLGLVPAVKWLASDLTKNYGIASDVEVIGSQRKLTPDAELMLFRITQEALTNVRRHSGAGRVSIRVEFAGGLTRVTISDNGGGFEAPARAGDLARIGKLGLAGMEERAQLLGGTLTIDSVLGKGTTLTVEVPL